MNNKIICPFCNKEFAPDEAMKHKMQEEISADLAEKHKLDLERVKAEAEEKAKKIITEDLDLKLKDKDNENEELRNKNKELGNQLLELTKSIRELKDQNDRRDLETEKRISEEADRAKEKGAKEEREKVGLEVEEYKKKLLDTQKALAEAQSKAKQGSQQLQGEVLELDLEEKLRNAFIYDEISPIGKGVEGGDIIQKVRNQAGKIAGTILWETKRAKWSSTWLSKLREDGRKFDATLVVLVTINLPNEIENFQVIDNVIITSNKFALALAGILRRDVMKIASAKFAAENKDEKLESLYQYLQSETFKSRFEAFAEGVIEMQEDLLTEKRSAERLWKKRETQIGRTINNMSKMYGELQGIMGTALPDIKKLSLPSGDEEDQ